MNLNLVFLIIGLVVAALWAWLQYMRIKLEAANPPPLSQVVVNMPADAKPLEQLASVEVDATISAPRAVLWWTVYRATLDHYLANGTDAGPRSAVERANSAVEAAYGPIPSVPTPIPGSSTYT
jgi:hypothetical protein